MDNKEQYKSICGQYPSLPVFLQHWWLDAVCEDWQVAIEKKGEHVTGVWPYMLLKKMGVSLLRNPPLTPYLGPHMLYPPDIKDSNRDHFEHEATQALFTQLPDAKVWNLSLQPGFSQAGFLKSKGLSLQVQQTFLIDLSADETALFANLKENLRRNIRAAEKEISITDASENLPELYQFQKHTLSGKGANQAHSLAQMQQLMAACRKQNAAALWVAKKGDAIQAIIWNVWDAGRSYYFMGAQNPAADNYRAMSLLLWHAIKEAKKRGNLIFDLEGSMDQGVERFFRSFSGKRELYLVLKKNKSLLWKLKEALGR